ncbi:unnamed protein product [Protopolystoma xenopodis]|uniref:Uncharacterized protein n=1 Tax=Protopolystoma xenopodis TaxID=117903 RepID=A0A3S4ZM44_9PLAT|nr:unnamed protein product [Protopolystoma xenopodis]
MRKFTRARKVCMQAQARTRPHSLHVDNFSRASGSLYVQEISKRPTLQSTHTAIELTELEVKAPFIAKAALYTYQANKERTNSCSAERG